MDKTLIAIAVCLVGGGGEVVVLLVGSWIIDRRNARRRAVA